MFGYGGLVAPLSLCFQTYGFVVQVIGFVGNFVALTNNYMIMKKILFLLAMLPMMVFTACSSDDSKDSMSLIISSGDWSISNDGDSYLNVRYKETNWLTIDNSSNIIDFYMEPNLGSVMTAWNQSFRTEGNTIYIETDYYTHRLIFSDVTKSTARATVYYDGREPFKIYLRKR